MLNTVNGRGQQAAEPISTQNNRQALAEQANAILKRANCDTTSGAKKDRRYRRNKRAERDKI